MLNDPKPILQNTPLEKSLLIPFDDLYFSGKKELLHKIFKKAKSTKEIICIDKTKEAIHKEEQLETVDSFLQEYNIKDRAIVLDTTQNDTLFNQYQIKHIGAMFHVWNYILSYSHRQNMPKWFDHIEQPFLCLNNWHKQHRYEIINRLHERKIIDSVKWSYRQSVSDSVFTTPKYLDQADFPKPDLDINFDQNLNLAEMYGSSLCTIANETDYYENNITHVTEKSLLAFYYGTVPIIVGVPYSVKLLRDHGLDTFDDIIDHSYDSEENHDKRMDMILDSIEKIHKLPDYYEVKVSLRKRIRANQYFLIDKQHWLDYYRNKILTFNNF